MAASRTRRRVSDPRQRVLSAALGLFAREGYFNTSIPDIVRESGVSIGSIYHHFGDKEGVAQALFDALVEQMDERLSEIRACHTTCRERCRAIIGLMFRITEEEPEAMHFMLFARHREFLRDAAPVCSSHPFRMMREMVAQGMVDGEIRPMDPMVAASAVFGGAFRLVSLQLDGLLERPLREYLPEVWECAWRAVAKEA